MSRYELCVMPRLSGFGMGDGEETAGVLGRQDSVIDYRIAQPSAPPVNNGGVAVSNSNNNNHQAYVST